MTNEQMSRLEIAEDILTSLYWEIRDEHGCSKEAKRLDTIIGKLYNLRFYARIRSELKERQKARGEEI